MQKRKILYDDYESLCESIDKWPKIQKVKLSVPTEEDLVFFEEKNVLYNLSLIVWVTEFDRELDDDDQGMIAILDKILESKVEFSDNVPTPKKIKVGYGDYKAVCDFADKTDLIPEGFLPTKRAIEKIFKKDIIYSFSLVVAMLRKNKKRSGTEAYKILRDMALEVFEIDKPDVFLTKREYEGVIKEVKDSRYERDSWWPKKEDIRDILEPNFKECYDFVLWLLHNGPEPKTLFDFESRKLLKNLVAKKLMVTDEEILKWL